MKKIFQATALTLFSGAALAGPSELAGYDLVYGGADGALIDQIKGRPVEAPGTAAEIIGRAQSCAVQSISTGPVTATSVLSALGGGAPAKSAGGGPAIELADPANGQLVARNQVTYTSSMTGRVAQSRLLVEAKDGRFRISQSDISVTLGGGYGSHPVAVHWGTGWENDVRALIAPADKIAKCISAPPAAGDNW
jgi:hypothetical protein